MTWVHVARAASPPAGSLSTGDEKAAMRFVALRYLQEPLR